MGKGKPEDHSPLESHEDPDGLGYSLSGQLVTHQSEIKSRKGENSNSQKRGVTVATRHPQSLLYSFHIPQK